MATLDDNLKQLGFRRKAIIKDGKLSVNYCAKIKRRKKPILMKTKKSNNL